MTGDRNMKKLAKGLTNWEMIRYLVKLLQRRQKRLLGLFLVLGILSPAVDLLSISAVLPVLRDASGISPDKTFTRMAFLGGIFLLKGAFDLLRIRISNHFLQDVVCEWSVKIYDLYGREELLEHNKRSSVQQIAGIRTDTEVCADLLVTSIIRIFRMVTLAGYFFLASYVERWTGVGLCLLVAASVTVLFSFCRRHILRYGEKKRKGDIRIAAMISIAYGLYKEMKTDSRSEKLLGQFGQVMSEHTKVQKEYMRMTQGVSVLFQSLLQAGMFFLLAFMIMAGTNLFTFWADIIFCITFLAQIAPNVVFFVTDSNKIQYGRKSYEIFQENMNRYLRMKEEEKRQEQIRERQITLTEGIRIEHLTFRYPNGTKVLEDVSAEIPAGCSTAIIGDSGTGKTTFLDLLLGLLEPQAGSIRYDDYDIVKKQDSQGPCRGQIGRIVSYIPQIVYLNGDTICRNVSFLSAGNADEEKVVECLKRARVWEEVKKLPDGIHTLIGENGTTLSGGQRQRVALARALYKEFELLIMDEATSALDRKTAMAVMDSVFPVKGDKTLLIVTHRLELANECDVIYKIEDHKLIKIK